MTTHRDFYMAKLWDGVGDVMEELKEVDYLGHAYANSCTRSLMDLLTEALIEQLQYARPKVMDLYKIVDEIEVMNLREMFDEEDDEE